VKRIRELFSGPLAVLGGGGYDMDTVARAWTLAWSILVSREVPDPLPDAYIEERGKYGTSIDSPYTLRDPVPDPPPDQTDQMRHLEEVLGFFRTGGYSLKNALTTLSEIDGFLCGNAFSLNMKPETPAAGRPAGIHIALHSSVNKEIRRDYRRARTFLILFLILFGFGRVTVWMRRPVYPPTTHSLERGEWPPQVDIRVLNAVDSPLGGHRSAPRLTR